ncbi:MAG: tRNA (adenosine(37)-N6)-threonylcarbamoyltransferase complex transferase subunit TsaD [Pirellulaceae bacterium]
MNEPRILAIETTCDETAAAVVTTGPSVLASVVASQEDLHQRFRGVVPEIAARAHVERILPVIDETFQQADLQLDQIDAFAVANQPGLAGSLIVGLMAAKTLALVTGKPLIAVNHLHAHIYACQFDEQETIFPCVGLVVSGGHSHLYRCENAFEFELLGGTIDDAAGEAFDKVASMLGLAYPGGPAISRVAEQGNSQAFQFPRSFIREDRLAFSFSGLKTAVRYEIAGTGNVDFTKLDLSDQVIADVAASFQEAVIDCLVTKSFQAIEQTGCRTLCVGGGVAANQLLRTRLQDRAKQHGVRLCLSRRELCTDNAVMGAIALEKFQAGIFDDLELDILPGLVRG